jgi:7-carboxy-7-deazaguanine synthase
MTVEEISDEVARLEIEHVVLTGGEPMLFDAVVELARLLHRQKRKITVETAGTIWRDLPCDLMSISPKLSNSTPADPGWAARHETTRQSAEVVARLVKHYPYQLKFVVDLANAEEEIEEIETYLACLPRLEPERVQLMPQGIDREELLAKSRALVPICMSRGWRLCNRLHIDLFGNTPGT